MSFRGTTYDLEKSRLAAAEEEERLLGRMKKHVEKYFGRNNIMFDCVIDTNVRTNRTGFAYNNTCKLCGHVTRREQRTKTFFVCSGCYREWDRDTNEILLPNSKMRVALARKNGKLVLPCDEISEDEDEDVEPVSADVAPIVSPDVGVTVRTFTHVILRPGQFYQIGDMIFEYVD
jgi:hypothetical protein